MKVKQFYELFSQRIFDLFKKLFEHFSLSLDKNFRFLHLALSIPQKLSTIFFIFFFAAVETKLERYKNDLKGNKEEEKKRESH
jgi:hypothetical protein